MAEENEEDDLLDDASSDNEELSENEENLYNSRQTDSSLKPTTFYEKIRFVCTAFAIVITSSCLLIFLPLCTESLNLKGDAYTALLFLSATSTGFFFLLSVIFGIFYGHKAMLWLPFPIYKISRASLIFGLSGILVIYALDRNRVMCHLQDPIKGVVLVFALVFYFCFSRKVLSLQKIFCCTTIIIGLFISVDYGLCDEFRCRGYERKTKSEDSGDWSAQAHTVWTLAYMTGLALWTIHFSLLEEMVVAQESSTMICTEGLLTTVSRLVFNQDSSQTMLIQQESSNQPIPRPLLSPGLRAITLAMWIHLISLILTISLSWSDMIDVIGTASSSTDFWNVTESGLSCLLSYEPGCDYVKLFAWLLVASYIGVTLSSLQMLIISQSAVLTLSVIAAALPLVGIWWSLFALTPTGGMLKWSPGVTGEMICSVLGLPVVMVALCLMCKSFLIHPVDPSRLRGHLVVLQV